MHERGVKEGRGVREGSEGGERRASVTLSWITKRAAGCLTPALSLHGSAILEMAIVEFRFRDMRESSTCAKTKGMCGKRGQGRGQGQGAGGRMDPQILGFEKRSVQHKRRKTCNAQRRLGYGRRAARASARIRIRIRIRVEGCASAAGCRITAVCWGRFGTRPLLKHK